MDTNICELCHDKTTGDCEYPFETTRGRAVLCTECRDAVAHKCRACDGRGGRDVRCCGNGKTYMHESARCGGCDGYGVTWEDCELGCRGSGYVVDADKFAALSLQLATEAGAVAAIEADGLLPHPAAIAAVFSVFGGAI